MKRVHVFRGWKVTVTGRGIEWYSRDLLIGGVWYDMKLTPWGESEVQALVQNLFHEAEQVKRLSRRCKMSAGFSAGGGGITFSRSGYTPAEIAAWGDRLLAILKHERATGVHDAV